MKIILLALLVSCSSFADFVYMHEQDETKSVRLNTQGQEEILSDLQSKMWALYPDISSDGRSVVFSEGPGAQDLHLTVLDRKSKNLKRFHLSNKGMLLHPKFSKNGKMIFYSAPGKLGKNTIYFFDLKTEITRQGQNLLDYSLDKAMALDESEESYFPRPSSDGGFVVYQRNLNGKKEIVLHDRIEKTKTVLAEGMSPALSADETKIAFTSKKDGNWNIYSMNRITKVVSQVTSDSHDEMAPTFTASDEIAFASNKSGNFRLYLIKDEKFSNLTSYRDEALDLYSPQFSGEKKYLQGELAPFIGAARSSFGTVSHEGKLYMAGGHQGAEHTYPPESFSDTFIVYDIQKNSWSELAPRPRKAHGFQIAAYKNYIYAFGGFAYSPEHKPKWRSLDEIDRYDIKKNQWETVGKLNSRRSSNVAVTIGDKVYLAGGWDSTPKKENDFEGTFLEAIEIFDLKSEKVNVASYKLPSPLRRALTGIAHNDKIILVGGLGQGASHFELLNQVTMIDPMTGSTTELTPLPFSTFAPAAEILGNELFVFGGMFKTGNMSYEYVGHIFGMDLGKKVWRHTGRYLSETKGFSQVFPLSDKTLGVLGGHRYFDGFDSPVATFETFGVK